MTVTSTLSFDLLLSVANHLGDRDLLNLSTTQQVLNEPIIRRAFIVALTVPFDHDLKPVTYAIKNGDIQLLSKAISFLDTIFPAGWKWWQFYTSGLVGPLSLAASHSLESLQYLVQKYPLMPGAGNGGPISADLIPAHVLEHGFYSYKGDANPALLNIRNWDLIITALKASRYDCASFLLNYQPRLFPNGFPLKGNKTCYSSVTMLNFLIDHGADLGNTPLHDVVALINYPDARVFDVLVQRGCNVDSPLETLTHPPLGHIFTPLHNACHYFQLRSIEALLRLGANPNGVSGSFWIGKAPLIDGFHYFSPSPILTLLLSPQWDLSVRNSLINFGRKFIDCLQSLIHSGATTSIPFNGNILEILLLRIWRCLYNQTKGQENFVLPDCPDQPHENQGVRSFLLALGSIDVSPWEHICEVVLDINPAWSGSAGQTRGKELLIRLFTEYQDKFGDLPGPSQLESSFLFNLPDRYETQSTSMDTMPYPLIMFG
ncbi:hypothetical protein F4859DRAFT_458300 [Xylaria cf. heliscus]|nr:hypothetical protein F4859DRAFT_458300 [Xylaria cf. heliscus]